MQAFDCVYVYIYLNVSPDDCIISCECCGTVTFRTQVFIRCPFMQYVYLVKHLIVFMYTSMCIYMWCICDQKHLLCILPVINCSQSLLFSLDLHVYILPKTLMISSEFLIK